MKYLMRLLAMILYVIGIVLNVFGVLLSIILSILQIPVWFVWKGEFLKDDDTIIIWYVEHVIGWAEDMWEKMLRWSE